IPFAMQSRTAALHPPVVPPADDFAIVHHHRPDRDPALGEPGLGFRNRGSQEGVHEYKEYAKLIVSPAVERQRDSRARLSRWRSTAGETKVGASNRPVRPLTSCSDP